MLPFNVKRTLKVEFQSQFEKPCPSIEMKFDKLIKLNLEPIAPRYTCDILGAAIKKIDNYFCWADTPPNFDINAPPKVPGLFARICIGEKYKFWLGCD